jgi:hypothetical protein
MTKVRHTLLDQSTDAGGDMVVCLPEPRGHVAAVGEHAVVLDDQSGDDPSA